MHGEKRGYEKRDNSTEERKYGGDTNIEAGNVDVYYWPGPNANTSCQSIIGNRVNPPDYGATTDSLGLRWVHSLTQARLSNSTERKLTLKALPGTGVLQHLSQVFPASQSKPSPLHP